MDGTIVDGAGHEVRLIGVNWFGFETSTFAPQGLWARNWQDMLDQIKAAGFNTIRLPYTNQLLDHPSPTPNGIDYTKNPDLRGLHGLALMDRIIDGAGQRGLRVILDRHRPTAAGQSDLWYTKRVPESRWLTDWTELARHYRGNPAVIGADLHNEPHGRATWGDGHPRTDWRLAAERAGNAILSVNPDWLIFVEGIENYHGDWYWWGGNLKGARHFPVRLSQPDKLVYSAHDYGPEVFPQPWFKAHDYPHNLPSVWQRYWAYLKRDQRVPVFVGEFGGRSVGQDRAGQWQRTLVAFLQRTNTSYAYWSWNPNSSDTGGLLEDDWRTLNEQKLRVLSAKDPSPAGTGRSPRAASRPDDVLDPAVRSLACREAGATCGPWVSQGGGGDERDAPRALLRLPLPEPCVTVTGSWPGSPVLIGRDDATTTLHLMSNTVAVFSRAPTSNRRTSLSSVPQSCITSGSAN